MIKPPESPSARQPFKLLFGILWPPVNFALDPFFFSQGFLLGAQDSGLLGAAGSVEAYTCYGLLAAMIFGMMLHLMGVAGWLARPLLLIGLLFSACFGVLCLPMAPMAIAVIPAPFVLSPYACLVAYWMAVEDSRRAPDGRRTLWADVTVAALLVVLALAPIAHVSYLERELRSGERPRIAAALRSLLPYGDLGRPALRRAYRDAGVLPRRRMRAMCLELTGEDLLDRIDRAR